MTGGFDETYRDAEQLMDEITELAAHIAAATCHWLELIAEFERRELHHAFGFATCPEWLAWACSLSPVTAREHVRVAKRLAELPAAREEFAGGRLSYSKVRALCRIATPENEAHLVELARQTTAAQLERVVRGYQRSLPAEDVVESFFLNCAWDDDGSLRVRGRLCAEEGALLERALQVAREELRGTARTPNGQSDDSAESESPRPTNADALALLADTLLASGSVVRPGGERCQIVVHVDADVLADAAEEGACQVEGGGGLHPEAARRLGCDASLVRIVERDGRPLSVGRRRRTIPPALRRALNARDAGCRFPGCERHAPEAHHVEHWAHGGETKLSNLVQLCRHHHRLVHEGGYSVEPNGAGFRFRRPSGEAIGTLPCRHRGDEHRLRDRNARRGARIDADAIVPMGRGGRIDYGMAVGGLLWDDCSGSLASGARASP